MFASASKSHCKEISKLPDAVAESVIVKPCVWIERGLASDLSYPEDDVTGGADRRRQSIPLLLQMICVQLAELTNAAKASWRATNMPGMHMTALAGLHKASVRTLLQSSCKLIA